MISRLAFSIFILLFLVTPGTAADLDTMIGQMLLAGFRGYEVNENSPVIRDIEKYHLGGIILFDYDVTAGSYDRNIKNPAQVQKLVADLKSHATIPLLTSIDQEGGKVQRLKSKYGFTGTPSAEKLGKESDTKIEVGIESHFL